MAYRPGREIKGPFVTGGNPDTVVDSPATTTAVGAQYNLAGQLGAILRSNDGTKEWIYVQYSATSTGKATAANQIAFWVSSTSTVAASIWVVDNQTSANSGFSANAVAGIIRTTSTNLNGKYLWVLRKALSCNVVSTSTKQIKGDVVIATTASGEAGVVLSTSTDLTATVGGAGIAWFGGNTKLGIVNSTTTSSVNIDVMLDVT